MARISVDFSEVQDFEAMPKGEYACIIESVEVRDSQRSEYQYLNWTLLVSEGEFKDRKLWLVTSFSPKALFRMKEVFVNLGIYGEDEEIDIDYDDETMMVVEPELAGLPCTAVVSQEPDQQDKNKIRNRVDSLLPIDAPKAGQKVAGGGAPAPQKTKAAAEKTPAKNAPKKFA